MSHRFILRNHLQGMREIGSLALVENLMLSTHIWQEVNESVIIYEHHIPRWSRAK